MFTRSKFLSTLAISTLLLSVGSTFLTSSYVGAQSPESTPNPATEAPPLSLPPLIPPTLEEYVKQPLNVPITARDRRPVGKLVNPPGKLAQEIYVNLPPDTKTFEPDVVAFKVRSSVRYVGNGHIVVVTTAVPSPAAAKLLTNLGNQEVQLPNGSTAFATDGLSTDTPNRLVFKRGNLIITVASDLPIDQIKGLAANVDTNP